MKSAINIYMSLHTQISRAEKQMRKSGSDVTKSFLNCFGNDMLDNELIGGKSFLPGDATILLKGERGTHKLALAANYLFRGLRKKENVILFNMGSTVEIDRIPQCATKPVNRLSFSKSNLKGKKKKKFSDMPPEGKYKLHWWVFRNKSKTGEEYPLNKPEGEEISDVLKKHANLFMLDFDAGFLLPEEFIATFINLVEWIKGKEAKSKPKPQRILLNSTAQIKTRFPVLEEESFLIPAFIRLTKCYGMSSMIIDVNKPTEEGPKRIVSLDALSDLIITIENNWKGEYQIVAPENFDKPEINQLKIITADNITGKVYKKKWLGLWIEEAKLNLRLVNVSEGDLST